MSTQKIIKTKGRKDDTAMFEFIIKYWIEFLFSLTISAVGFIYKKINAYAVEQEAIKNGIKAILYDKIMQKCKENLEKGYITLDELEDIKHISISYKELGGNGTAKIMIERVTMLPIKEAN